MDALEKYLHDHTSSEDPLLQELDRETHMREVAPRMLSGHLQGRLFELFIRMTALCAGNRHVHGLFGVVDGCRTG